MEVVERIVEHNPSSKGKVPVTIEWKGERMIRGHSVLSSVKQIVRMVQSVDVVKVLINGDMGLGKTTFARFLSCAIHTLSEKEYKVPFAVRELSKVELLDFENTIKNLEPVNSVLIFDDVSYISNNKNKAQIETVKQKMTEIRHLEDKNGNEMDVKIIIIMITHYTLALQKYLRQNNFCYFVNVGSSEMDNMLKIVGNHYQKLLHKFQKIVASATTKGKFSFSLGKKSKFFTYTYREPYIPLLFFDNDKLRVVVSPTRQWYNKFCATCNKSKGVTPLKDNQSIMEFTEDIEHKFGKQIARNSIRLLLHQNGLNVYPKSIKYCLSYINKHVTDKIPNLQALAEHYNFSTDKTRLDSKYTRDLKK